MLRSWRFLTQLNGWRSTQQFYRSFATAQVNIKEHINVGTIGDEFHGKTTLTKAILNTLDNNQHLHGTNEDFNVLNKDKLSQIETSGNNRTINYEFETVKRHCLLADNTGNKDHVTNMIVGSSQLECAILCISAVDGISHMAKQHLLILQHLQCPNIIVYFNKIDDESFDPELQELIEMEVEETLQKYNFDTDKIPFIRGSALNAMNNKDTDSIIQILNELDNVKIEDATNENGDEKEEDIPFLMPIQTIYNIKGVGIAVIGKAVQGIISTGDSVELIGSVPFATNQKFQGKNMNIDANVASLKLFDHSIKIGKKRDYLGININGTNVNTKNIKRGMYVVKQSKNNKDADALIRGYWKFECKIEFYASECAFDGHGNAGDNDDYIGRTTPMGVGFQPVFHWITNDCSGRIEGMPEDKNGVIMPGDTVDGVLVCLQQSAVIWKGLRFMLREAGRTIGAGIITQPIDL